LGESPFGMAAATWVEFFQHLDARVAVPLAVTGIGGTVLAGIAALAHRGDRAARRLLGAACAFGAIGSLITIVVNVPINEEIATWSPAELPPGYEVILRRWWNWHQARLIAAFAAMCLVFVAMLRRESAR
jgi:uncharacterized membrane protein